MRLPSKSCMVWLYFCGVRKPGIFFKGHFYNAKFRKCLPQRWEYRFSKCLLPNQTNGASGASVIPLNMHPEFVPTRNIIN